MKNFWKLLGEYKWTLLIILAFLSFVFAAIFVPIARILLGVFVLGVGFGGFVSMIHSYIGMILSNDISVYKRWYLEDPENDFYRKIYLQEIKNLIINILGLIFLVGVLVVFSRFILLNKDFWTSFLSILSSQL